MFYFHPKYRFKPPVCDRSRRYPKQSNHIPPEDKTEPSEKVNATNDQYTINRHLCLWTLFEFTPHVYLYGRCDMC